MKTNCTDNYGLREIPCDLPIPQTLKKEWHQLATRRHFLGSGSTLLGCAGLASLLNANTATANGSARSTGVLGSPHHSPVAKRVIYLFMSGAPPQMDLWDYKPDLAKWFNKDMPESVRGTAMPTGMTAGQTRFPVAPPHWGFKQHGECGRWISDLLPQTAKLTDDIAVINSMHTDAINHEPAILMMNTGNMVPG